MKKSLKVLAGAAVGCINGMFGAGGGMLAVPLLKKCGLDQKSAHANAVAIMLPLTALSCVMYSANRLLPVSAAWGYVPTGLAGAFLGTWLLKKIRPKWLQRIFGGLMVYAGVRLIWK